MLHRSVRHALEQHQWRSSAAAVCIGRKYTSVVPALSPACSMLPYYRNNNYRIRRQQKMSPDARSCSSLLVSHHHANGEICRFISIQPTSTTPEDRSKNNNITIDDMQQLTNDEQNLLQHTQTLLRDISGRSIGSLTYDEVTQISNCIEQWITSGDHRYIGAKHVHELLQRLIMERADIGRTHLEGVIRYYNDVYHGGQFVDQIVSIISSMERACADFAQDEELEEQQEEVPYKIIISLLCNCYTAHATTAAELILHRFEMKLQDAQCPLQHSNPPTVETYNAILTSWAKSSGRRKHVKMSSSSSSSSSSSTSSYIPYFHHPNVTSNLVSQMLQLYNSNPTKMERMRPDFLSFNVAISSLTREQHFWKNNNNSDDDDYIMNNQTYHRTIGKACFDHLQTMLAFYRQGYHACAPDLITFSTVLMTLGRGKDKDDEIRAMKILDEMLHLCGIEVEHHGKIVLNTAILDFPTTFTEVYGGWDREDQLYQYNVLPRNKHFNVVLALMAQSRRVTIDTLERARRYVDIMEQLGHYENQRLLDNPPIDDDVQQSEEGNQKVNPFGEGEDSRTNSKPDAITYNTLLKIAAKAGQPMVADDILQEMITKSSEGNIQVRPDNTSFNTVLLAWSKSRNNKAQSRVTELLQSMQDMADNGHEHVRPDHVSMTTVINTLAQSAKKNRNTPSQAEAIIERMESNKETALRPDVVTYTSLIKCWMESGALRAASRAEEIIEKLHKRHEDGYFECKPDTMAYNVALNAIAKCKGDDSAQRAEALLERMQDRFMAGDLDVAPTAPSFVTVMSAWARSNHPKGGTRAEALLHKMHELHKSGVENVAPNTFAYSTCILAWSKSGQRKAGKRAQDLLKEMERCRDEGLDDVKPNAITYTNVMEAWIASKQPDALEKVEAILEHMITQSNFGDVDSAPTTTTFNVLLKAIRHSGHPEMHRKAEEVLNHMKTLYVNGDDRVKPNIITYNTFIATCARTGGNEKNRRNAFSLVLTALKEINEDKDLRADAYTWPAIWQACQCLLDVKTDLPQMNSLFDLTVKDGAFNELLFNNIRGFLPASYLQKKLNRQDDVKTLTVHDLPPQWTCNVKLGRLRKPTKRSAKAK